MPSLTTPGPCVSATGTVVGCPRPGRVEVELAAPPRCEGCHGLCLWRRLPAAGRVTLAARTRLSVGQRVAVRMPERSLLLTVLLVYGAPLAALLVGAVVGRAATGSDAAAAVTALAALLLVAAAAPRLRLRVERLVLGSIDVRPSGD